MIIIVIDREFLACKDIPKKLIETILDSGSNLSYDSYVESRLGTEFRVVGNIAVIDLDGYNKWHHPKQWVEMRKETIIFEVLNEQVILHTINAEEDYGLAEYTGKSVVDMVEDILSDVNIHYYLMEETKAVDITL